MRLSFDCLFLALSLFQRFILRGLIVGQTIRTVEVLSEQMIDRADDVRNDRLWCVVDAASLSYLRIIRGEKRLVEMHHRILMRALLAEIGENRYHI